MSDASWLPTHLGPNTASQFDVKTFLPFPVKDAQKNFPESLMILLTDQAPIPRYL